MASRYVTGNGSVIVPPRIAHWLETKTGVTADWRISLQGTDPEAYEVMLALHMAALRHRAGIGTNSTVGQSERAESKLMSTTEAAREMKVTDRCIRKWITAGRLPATMSGCRWLVNRDDLHTLGLTA
jgi:excisionase family DNA binding protein